MPQLGLGIRPDDSLWYDRVAHAQKKVHKSTNKKV